MNLPPLITFPDRHLKGIDGVRSDGQPFRNDGRPFAGGMVSPPTAWIDHYDSDAHCVAYSCDGATVGSVHPRLRKCAAGSLHRAGATVHLRWGIIDADREQHEPWPNPHAQWPAVLSWIRSAPLCATAGVYMTRCGIRLIWPLDPPIPVDKCAGHLAGLYSRLRAMGIPADVACMDWTRLFRLPFVRRDGTDQRLPLDIPWI